MANLPPHISNGLAARKTGIRPVGRERGEVRPGDSGRTPAIRRQPKQPLRDWRAVPSPCVVDQRTKWGSGSAPPGRSVLQGVRSGSLRKEPDWARCPLCFPGARLAWPGRFGAGVSNIRSHADRRLASRRTAGRNGTTRGFAPLPNRWSKSIRSLVLIHKRTHEVRESGKRSFFCTAFPRTRPRCSLRSGPATPAPVYT